MIALRTWLPRKTGHAAMFEWDRTWQIHHLPMWAKKAVRLYAKKSGIWRPYADPEDFLPSDLFDHWGSIKHNGVRVLITQPYGEKLDTAIKFADEISCSVLSTHPGPWNEGTWLYEFIP